MTDIQKSIEQSYKIDQNIDKEYNKMSEKLIANLQDFQEWYKTHEEFYDPSNIETLAEMMEDYQKYKEQLKSVNEFGEGD